MKLISMTDFVLSKRNQSNLKTADKDDLNNYYYIQRYAEFLKQPLTLGMFVPCDENGIFLKEVERFEKYEQCPINGAYISEKFSKWEKAKERVLFKSFEGKGGLSVAKAICQSYQIIDDLTYKKVPLVDLELTETAIKQIGL